MIVGLLLMRMPPEDAFWLLVRIMDFYLADYFSPDLAQLRQDALVFDTLLARHARQVSKQFDRLGVESLTYLPQWLIPIYTVTLPWPSVLRVWDMFFCDGVKALHRVAIAIILSSKEFLLKHCTTSSDALSFLIHIPRGLISADSLISNAVKVRLKKEDIQKLRGRIKNLNLKMMDSEEDLPKE